MAEELDQLMVMALLGGHVKLAFDLRYDYSFISHICLYIDSLTICITNLLIREMLARYSLVP